MKQRSYSAEAVHTIGRIGKVLTHLWSEDKALCGVRVRTHPLQAVDGKVTCSRCLVHLEAVLLSAWGDGDAKTVELTLSWGADVSKLGVTALSIAVNLRCPDFVRRLLDAGAPVDQRGKLGTTPLMDASYSKCLETVQVLLAAGADIEADGDSGADQWGTPLVLAAKTGDLDLVQFLIEAGADITGGVKRWQPLQWAVRTNGVEIVRYLLGFPHTTEALDLAIREARFNNRPHLEPMIQSAIDRGLMRAGVDGKPTKPRRIM